MVFWTIFKKAGVTKNRITQLKLQWKPSSFEHLANINDNCFNVSLRGYIQGLRCLKDGQLCTVIPQYIATIGFLGKVAMWQGWRYVKVQPKLIMSFIKVTLFFRKMF